MQVIEYEDYDKISDDMMYLGNNITMRFNVLLSRRTSTSENTRRFFHSEYRYKSKYNDTNSAVSIKRCFSYYISFDIGQDWEKSVMVRIQDIIILRKSLEEVIKWTNDGTFTVVSGGLAAKKRKTIKVQGMPENKYIWFDPIVIELNGVQSPGIRVTFSDPGTYVNMTMDNFFGLVYLINTADMFGYAQSMLNYIGRPPEYGYNMKNFDNEYNESLNIANNNPIKASKGRQIPGVKKNKSAFENN